MEKNNELSEKRKSYFKRYLNFNFAIIFNIIIFILFGNGTYTLFKKIIVQ